MICALPSPLFLEIHKVFLQKSVIARTQILSQSALAAWIAVYPANADPYATQTKSTLTDFRQGAFGTKRPGRCPFSLCSCKEKVDKKRKHARGGDSVFPLPETPPLNRQRRGLLPSFDSPCRCAGSIFFAAERHFRRGSRPAAAGGRRRQDAISAAAPLCAPEPFGRGPQTAFAARWIGSRRTCFPRGGRESEDAITCM